MTKLLAFRKKYPQYDRVDDNTLSEALYKRHYSERVSLDEFNTLFRGAEDSAATTAGKSLQNAGLSFPKIVAGLAEQGMDNIVQDRQFRDNPNIKTEGLAAYDRVQKEQSMWQGLVNSKPESVTNDEFDKAEYYDEHHRERGILEKGKELLFPDPMQAASKAIDLLTDNVPADKLERTRDSFQHVRKDYEKSINENKPKIHDPESLKGIMGEAIEGSASMVAAIGTYALTKNAGLASAAIFPYAKSGSYTESKDKGLSLSESNQRSNVLAGAEMLTEKLPLDVLLSKGKSYVMKIMKAGIFEGVEEAAVEAITYMYDRGVINDKTPIEELPARMWHSFKVGAFMGSGLKGTGVAIERTQGYLQARAEDKEATNGFNEFEADKFSGNDLVDDSKEFNLLDNGKSERDILAMFEADPDFGAEFDQMVAAQDNEQDDGFEASEQLDMNEQPISEQTSIEQPQVEEQVLEPATEQPNIDISALTEAAFEANEQETEMFFQDIDAGNINEDQVAPTLQGIIDRAEDERLELADDANRLAMAENEPVAPVEELVEDDVTLIGEGNIQKPVEEQPVTDLPTETVDKVEPFNDQGYTKLPVKKNGNQRYRKAHGDATESVLVNSDGSVKSKAFNIELSYKDMEIKALYDQDGKITSVTGKDLDGSSVEIPFNSKLHVDKGKAGLIKELDRNARFSDYSVEGKNVPTSNRVDNQAKNREKLKAKAVKPVEKKPKVKNKAHQDKIELIQETYVALDDSKAAGTYKKGIGSDEARTVAKNIKAAMVLGESFDEALKTEQARDNYGAEIFVEGLGYIEQQVNDKKELNKQLLEVKKRNEQWSKDNPFNQESHDKKRAEEAIVFDQVRQSINKKIAKQDKLYDDKGKEGRAFIRQAVTLFSESDGNVSEEQLLRKLDWLPPSKGADSAERSYSSKATFYKDIENVLSKLRNDHYKDYSDTSALPSAIKYIAPLVYKRVEERQKGEIETNNGIKHDELGRNFSGKAKAKLKTLLPKMIKKYNLTGIYHIHNVYKSGLVAISNERAFILDTQTADLYPLNDKDFSEEIESLRWKSKGYYGFTIWGEEVDGIELRDKIQSVTEKTGKTKPATSEIEDDNVDENFDDFFEEEEPKPKATKKPIKKSKPKSDKPASNYGKENKVFTADAAQKARDILKAKMRNLNSGLDPEIVTAGISLAGYHIEAGARKFADFSKAMVEDIGENVKPYLRSWYEGVRYYPNFDSKGMSSAAEIESGIEESIEAVQDEETESTFDDLMTTPISDLTAKEFKTAAIAEIESKGDAYVTEKLENFMEVHGLGMFSARRYLSFEQGFWNAYDYVEVVEHAISAKNGVAGDFTDLALLLGSMSHKQSTTSTMRQLLTNISKPYYDENVGMQKNSVIVDESGNAAHDAGRNNHGVDYVEQGELTFKQWADNVIDGNGNVYSFKELASFVDGKAIGNVDMMDQKEPPLNTLNSTVHDDINTPFVKSVFKMALKEIGIPNTAKNRLDLINVLNSLVNLGYGSKQRKFAADLYLTPLNFNVDHMIMWVATLGSVSGNRPEKVTSWFRHKFNNGRSVRFGLDKVGQKATDYYSKNTGKGIYVDGDKSLKSAFTVLAENYDKIKEALNLPALPAKEKTNVPTTSNKVERDSKPSEDPTTKPEKVNDDGSTDTGRVSSNPDGQNASEVQSKSDESISNNADPVSRTDGTNGILQSDGSVELDEDASDPEQLGRGDSDNDNGSETRQDGANATNNVVEQLGLDKPVTPPSSVGGHKWADLESIKQSAPALQAEQAQDLVHIEKRFFEDNGNGFLATNGTGTGKTFVGLGTIARFQQQGKKNVLVLVPSDGIANEWATTDKKYFNLGVYKIGADGSLKTKDKGQAITVVTYASFAQNKALILDRDKWDLVVADESQKLMSGANAKETGALDRLRILTNHEKSNYSGAKLKYEDEQNELNDLVNTKSEQLVAAYGSAGTYIEPERADKEAREYYESDQKAIDSKISAESDVRKKKGQLDTKVLFLSATPFPYVKTLDYAEGYLFNYSEYGSKYEGGYENSGHGHNSFFIQNFGYRWRYHKLNQPSGDVDTGIMERQFFENMKKSGRINGRALEVPFDFGRDYYITPTAAGQKLDELIDHWSNFKVAGVDENGNEVINDGKPTMVKPYEELATIIKKEFNYIKQIKLIEAIKAESVAKRIQEYVAQGKQAVIFHSYNVGGSENPIDLVSQVNPKLFDRYAKQFPQMVKIDFGDLKRPLDVFKDAFGDKVGFYNGGVSNKERAKLKVDFQNDDSNLRVLVVQVDAGEAGLSLHDLTGKHPRILTNIGVPAKPTQFTQVEGRIYRVGVQSEPHFEYPTTGTAFEDRLWSERISGRASTAENLAMGDEARRLKDSIVDGYTSAEIVDGLSASFGLGGKAKDKTVETSDWDRAKSYYWANEKRNKGNKSKEGGDYFATPEPLGMKMVEWLQSKDRDRLLEPSIGHGAIGRWFPETTNNKAVEQSTILSPRAQMIFKGKVITSDFEDFSILNKFEGIVMNPPFGRGGKVAYEHITKAIRHLTNGGRILAIVPDGGLAEKRLKDMMNNPAHKNIYLSAIVDLPSGAFSRAGTGVKTKILVLDRFNNPDDAPNGTHEVKLTAKDPNELFDKIESLDLPERLEATEREIDATQFMDTERKMVKSRKGAELYPVKLYTTLPYKLEKMFADLAKDFEGYATKQDANIFMFGDPEAKEDFIAQAAKTIVDLQDSGIELEFTVPLAKVAVEGESKNDYFELLDETYVTKSGANAGKENVQVDLLQRLDRDNYFSFVKWVENDMNGWYHKRKGHFMFESVDDAKRFIELGAKKLKGEPLISDEQMEAARKDFKDQIGRANSGLDPRLLKSAMILTAGYVERGAKGFMRYARAMRKYLGNIPTRFLNTWFNKHKKESAITTARKVIGEKIIKPIAKAIPYSVMQVDQIVRQQKHLFQKGKESLLQTFSQSIQDMQAYRNAILADAEKNIDEAWDKLSGEQSDILSQVMLDATMSRTDPSIDLEKQPKFVAIKEKIQDRQDTLDAIEETIARTGNITAHQERAMDNLAGSIVYFRKRLAEQRSIYNDVHSKYKQLGKDGKDMYAAVRDFYIDLWKKQENALKGRINELELDNRQRKIALDIVDSTFHRAASQGVYFPLARFGDYIVTVSSKETGRVSERYQFESQAEAETVLAKLKNEHRQNPDSLVQRDLLTTANHKKTDTTLFAKELIGKIKKLSDDTTATLQDDDLMTPDTSVKDVTEFFGLVSDTEVMDLIYQSMLRALPHNSSGKNLIHRSYIKGASTDQRRAFSQSAFRGAVTTSKIKYAHVTSKAIADMDKMVSDKGYPQEHKIEARKLAEHMNEVHDANMNPQGTAWGSKLITGAFLYHLSASPAAGLVNMSQTFLIGIPVLGSRYGVSDTITEISKLSGKFAQQAWKTKSGFSLKKSAQADAWVSLKDSDAVTASQRAILIQLHNEGDIELTQAHAMSQMAETDMRDKAIVNRSVIKGVRSVSSIFHNAEIFNREVIAVATMNLYTKAYKKKHGKAPSDEMIKEAARRAIKKIHFDYSSENRATLFRKFKLALVFKTYSQNITNIMLTDIKEAFVNADATERRAHAKSFIYMMTGHVLAGGYLALPLAKEMFWFASSLVEMLSGDDDEVDLLDEARTELNKINPLLEDIAFRGLLNTLGADWSNRIKLDGLFYRSSDREMSDKDQIFHYAQEILGAVFGTGVKIARGVMTMKQGSKEDDNHKYMKGLIAAMPKSMADPTKAFYRTLHGELDYKGNVLMPQSDFTEGVTPIWRTIVQTMGFSPSALTDLYDLNNAKKKIVDKVDVKRKLLMTRFYNLEERNVSTDGVWNDIDAFNDLYPEKMIKNQDLTKGLNRRAKGASETEGGMRLSDKSREQADKRNF